MTWATHMCTQRYVLPNRSHKQRSRPVTGAQREVHTGQEKEQRDSWRVPCLLVWNGGAGISALSLDKCNLLFFFPFSFLSSENENNQHLRVYTDSLFQFYLLMYGSELQLADNPFSLSTMWDPEVEVGSPGLGASALTFHVISLDPRLIFFVKIN